jgi:hypothetical protein
MEIDLPALKAQWSKREEVKEPVVGPEVELDRGHHHGHKH